MQKINQILRAQPPTRPESKPSSFDELFPIDFWKRKLIQCMKARCPDFIVDESNRTIMSEIFNWFWCLPQAKLNPHKGLLLCGPIGIGKSTLLRGLQQYALLTYLSNRCPVDRRFAFTSAIQVSLAYADNGSTAFDHWPVSQSLCIDEIGREPRDAKHYGTSINAIQAMLQLRYDCLHQALTHGTTNLNPDTDLPALYGDYVADRCKEMFNIIELSGCSRR